MTKKVWGYIALYVTLGVIILAMQLSSGCGGQELSMQEYCVKQDKICICHFPPGNETNPQDICIAEGTTFQVS